MTNSTDVTHARGKPCAAPRPLHAIDRFQETMKAHPDEAREIVATLFEEPVVHLPAQPHLTGGAGDLAVSNDHPLAALRTKHLVIVSLAEGSSTAP
jgi:hypothetical protein